MQATVIIKKQNTSSVTAQSDDEARRIAIRATNYNVGQELTSQQQQTVSDIIAVLTDIRTFKHYVNNRKTCTTVKYCINYSNMLGVARNAQKQLLAANISATLIETDTGLIVQF